MISSCMRLLASSAPLIALTGCASMTGLGGKSTYACQAPEGVTCNSVSGVYANATRNNLPRHPRPTMPAEPVPSPQTGSGDGHASAVLASLATAELRSPPRILRLWFKPWQDADDDLHEQGYVYVLIDAGRWRIDHVQRRIRDRFAPIKPPPRTDGAPALPQSRNDTRPPLDLSQQPQVPRPAAPTNGSD